MTTPDVLARIDALERAAWSSASDADAICDGARRLTDMERRVSLLEARVERLFQAMAAPSAAPAAPTVVDDGSDGGATVIALPWVRNAAG